jgi:ATP-dependent exoDNAse (exonuclease V) beta subunit
VAATRAKKNLHLMATVAYKNGVMDKAASGSFLERLWIPFQTVSENLVMDNGTTAAAKNPARLLQRLKISELGSPPIKEPIAEKTQLCAGNTQAAWENHTARQVGTVIHQILAHIAQTDLSTWDAKKIAQEKTRWLAWLIQAGCPIKKLTDSILEIQTVIARTLHDSRARWILGAHAAPQCEYALTSMIDGRLTQVVIDRTFIDENACRWIIDYKTSAPALDEDISSFLEKAQMMHREQLETYAAVLQKNENRPIRLGIYFPAFGGWCAWDFETS